MVVAVDYMQCVSGVVISMQFVSFVVVGIL